MQSVSFCFSSFRKREQILSGQINKRTKVHQKGSVKFNSIACNFVLIVSTVLKSIPHRYNIYIFCDLKPQPPYIYDSRFKSRFITCKSIFSNVSADVCVYFVHFYRSSLSLYSVKEPTEINGWKNLSNFVTELTAQ